MIFGSKTGRLGMALAFSVLATVVGAVAACASGTESFTGTLGTPPSQSGNYTDTHGGPFNNVPNAYELTSFTTANGIFLQVPQYNASLVPNGGTLLSVSVTYTIIVDQAPSFFNSGGTTTFTDTVSDSGNLYAPGSTSTVLASASGSHTYVITLGGHKTYDFANGDPDTYFSVIGTGTASGSLAVYTGTGNVQFDIDGTGAENFTGSSNIDDGVATYLGGSVVVTYTFITPEPGSWAVMGVGLFTGGLFLRRRRFSVQRLSRKSRSL
jgi:hypothetical protein